MEPVASLLLTLLAFGQSDEPAFSLPSITDSLPCLGPADEITVCGRRPSSEPWRIPPALRGAPMTTQNYSWSARARDEREAARYEDQVIGPAGAFNRSRQTDCQWRAERQQLTGRLIDCAQDIPFELRN